MERYQATDHNDRNEMPYTLFCAELDVTSTTQEPWSAANS